MSSTFRLTSRVAPAPSRGRLTSALLPTTLLLTIGSLLLPTGDHCIG